MSRSMEVNLTCESCKDIFKAKVIKPSFTQDTRSQAKCTMCDAEYIVRCKKPRGGAPAKSVIIGLERLSK